jgi:hypothetical protein
MTLLLSLILLLIAPLNCFAGDDNPTKRNFFFDLDLGSGVTGFGGSASDSQKELQSKGFSSNMPINASLAGYAPLSGNALIGVLLSYTHASLSDSLKNTVTLDISSASAYFKYYFSERGRGFYFGLGAGASFGVSLMPDSSYFLSSPSFGLALPRTIGYEFPLCHGHRFSVSIHSESNWLRGGMYNTNTLNFGLGF